MIRIFDFFIFLKEFLLTYFVGFVVFICVLGVVNLFPPFPEEGIFLTALFFAMIGTLPLHTLLMVLILQFWERIYGIRMPLTPRMVVWGIWNLSLFLIPYLFKYILSCSQLSYITNTIVGFGVIWFGYYDIIESIIMFLSISVWYYWRNRRSSKQK